MQPNAVLVLFGFKIPPLQHKREVRWKIGRHLFTVKTMAGSYCGKTECIFSFWFLEFDDETEVGEIIGHKIPFGENLSFFVPHMDFDGDEEHKASDHERRNGYDDAGEQLDGPVDERPGQR